jgi:hypothetical protein
MSRSRQQNRAWLTEGGARQISAAALEFHRRRARVTVAVLVSAKLRKPHYSMNLALGRTTCLPMRRPDLPGKQQGVDIHGSDPAGRG